MKLSDHFTLAELTASDAARKNGIENKPDAQVLRNLTKLAAVLEQVRAMVGKPVSVTSGYRSPAVNVLVGGARNSAHTFGMAADINVKGVTPKKLCELIRDSGIEYDQLILEYDRWTHIGISENPRRENLTIRTGTGYMKGIV